jgi:hypothetical protein
MQILVKRKFIIIFLPQQYVKNPTIKNCFRHIWYGVTTYIHFSFVIYKVGLVVLVSIDLNQWDLICFVGMNVVMGWRTTIETTTTQGQ